MRYVKRSLILVVVLLLLLAAGIHWNCHRALSRANMFVIQLRYKEARREFNRYLWLYPGDDQALLAFAGAYALDDRLDSRIAAGEALKLLERIDDEDPELAAEAGIQGARLRFLILHQPCAAERDLRTVLQNLPNSFAANYLMWKILDLTRRYYEAEPYFRACFASAERDRREELLREWYLSQFSTYSAATQLDQMMHFVAADRHSDAISEYRRLQAFVKSEANSALNHAVILDWYDEHHQTDKKRELFDKVWNMADATAPAFVYAVLFDLLLEDGRFDEAVEVFESWPEPRDGFDFSKREAILCSEIRNDPTTAITVYRAALAVWPGPVDWQLHHRLAGALVRVGQQAEADRIQAEEVRLQQLMEVNFHRELRESLLSTTDTARYAKMAKFYDDIGRSLEADAWRSLDPAVVK